MAVVDEESPFGVSPRQPPANHDIGQPLDLLSVSELRERAEMLQVELMRVEKQILAKEASRSAADAFFRL